MAWCFQDEADAYSDAVLDMLVSAEALAPGIFPFEIANVLLVAERRKRMAEAGSTRFLGLLGGLPIRIDQTPPDRLFSAVMAVGRSQGLSSCDAAYLELAMREGAALATRDDRLREAARRSGVKLLSVQS